MACGGLSRFAWRIGCGHHMQPQPLSQPGSAPGFDQAHAVSLPDPSKQLLDPPPGADRLAVALRADRSTVDTVAASCLDLLRPMERDARDEQTGMKSLVSWPLSAPGVFWCARVATEPCAGAARSPQPPAGVTSWAITSP